MGTSSRLTETSAIRTMTRPSSENFRVTCKTVMWREVGKTWIHCQ
jgi:hypothetical protein